MQPLLSIEYDIYFLLVEDMLKSETAAEVCMIGIQAPTHLWCIILEYHVPALDYIFIFFNSDKFGDQVFWFNQFCILMHWLVRISTVEAVIYPFISVFLAFFVTLWKPYLLSVIFHPSCTGPRSCIFWWPHYLFVIGGIIINPLVVIVLKFSLSILYQ